jgi:hypothetical protein
MSAEHNMINEDFVTFEVSKLLQDKGYRENCRAVYISAETGISKLVVLLFTSRKFGDLIRGGNGSQYERYTLRKNGSAQKERSTSLSSSTNTAGTTVCTAWRICLSYRRWTDIPIHSRKL